MGSKNYYSEEDIQIMKTTEDSKVYGVDRTDEIIAFAKEAGIKKLGVAYCISYRREAQSIIPRLEKEGFEVISVDCKYDKLAFSDILEGYNGIACNPAGQAAYLAKNTTELNIVLGLCLGHDIIFNSKSKAPTTTLMVKNRAR